MTFGKGATLYSTTLYGGNLQNGVVFSLKPPAVPGEPWTEEILDNFDGTTGDFPSGPLAIGENGVLYGAAEGQIPQDVSRALTNNGAAYSLAPPSATGQPWKYTVLYSYGAGLGPSGS